MNQRLGGSVAVVTGASRGIGAAIARAYAEQGASVVCAARGRDDIEQVAAGIRDLGGRAEALQCDVTDDGSVAALRAAADDVFGPPDLLVNNAGLYTPGRFLDHDLDAWSRTVDVNLFGTVRMTRAFLPAMLERGHGRVINVASTAGKYGSLFQSPYNASKHAVVGLTRCLALETASSGVRVNAICPGFVNTEMIDGARATFAELYGIGEDEVVKQLLARVPIGRLLTPEEVAELAVYLASPAGDAMTGQALTVAGGLILI